MSKAIRRSEAARKAWVTRKSQAKAMTNLGKCCVYVMHATGFDGTLRPSHDTEPHTHGWLTKEQAMELRNFIEAKMLHMTHLNGGGE